MNGLSLEMLRQEIASFADKSCRTCYFKEDSMSMVDPCFTCTMHDDSEPDFQSWIPDSWDSDKLKLYYKLKKEELDLFLDNCPEYQKALQKMVEYFNSRNKVKYVNNQKNS